jgi:hypothetical protein
MITNKNFLTCTTVVLFGENNKPVDVLGKN